LTTWLLSSSSDRRALDIVDGAGPFNDKGPHYSRRTPGSKTFTGVGREVVLVTECGRAVWACVQQRTPSARGTGSSRGRSGKTDAAPRYIWRNMLFRNLGAGLSSELIESATARTYEEWLRRYGSIPEERLRTEIEIGAVRSRNPGYCYKVAGWEFDRVVRGKLYMFAPVRTQPLPFPSLASASPRASPDAGPQPERAFEGEPSPEVALAPLGRVASSVPG